MDRTPPKEVRCALKREVGLGCPVPGCGNPYLKWHHFDPPWREREHHDLEGMIALCGQHHDQADAGTFTRKQLRNLKREGQARANDVRARFNWMRNSLLAIAGGNFTFETLTIFRVRGEPVIWFRRDEDGYLLLNIRMATISAEPRLQMEDNYWTLQGEPIDFECPPSGRLIHAKYENGDELRVEYFELPDAPSLKRRHADARPEEWGLPFPITAVEIHTRIGGTPYGFGPKSTTLPGMVIVGAFSRRSGCFIQLG